MKSLPTVLCLLSLGACVSAPTPQQMLDTGFRTPEMTFHTFQMAVRGDLQRLEYRCLSEGIRPAQGIYREFRETDLKGKIEYWLGIPDATIVESISLAADRHLLRAESHGYEFELLLVRESFWQVWQGGQMLVDEALSPGEMAGTMELYRDQQGSLVIAALGELTPSVALDLPGEKPVDQRSIRELNAAVSELRVGSEWKIDQFRLTPEE